MDRLPICHAKSKQSGQQCKNFATKGKGVCRIHGGASCGSKTPEGKLKQKMASWKHGLRSAEAVEEKLAVRDFIKKSRELIG